MMMQSVLAQTSGIISKTTGYGSGVKKSGEKEFEMLLDQGIKRETKIPVKAKAITENNSDRNNSVSVEKKSSAEAKENTMVAPENNKSIKSDTKDVYTKVIDSLQNGDEESTEQIDLELAGQIQAMLNQIRNAIMEELNLTSEELDHMMEDLGLELTDLTDPHAIMQLVLADSGAADSTAILLDEQLATTFRNILAETNDIKKEAFPKLTDDEIKLLMDQMNSSNEELIDSDEAGMLQPLDNQKKAVDESNNAKDDNVKFQAVSENGSTEGKSPAVTAKDDSDLSDTKGSKEEFVRTEGFEAFLDKLSANYENPFVEFRGNTLTSSEVREIAMQIIEQVRVIVNPEQTTMELQLYPEHLGKVNLTVSSKEGVMTAKFAVQNELVKEAVENQMITLKEALAEQGIKVEAIEVTIAGYTFDQKSQSDETNQMMEKKNKTGHKITFEEAVAMSEEPLNEEDAVKLADIRGYTVDYTA